MYMYVQYQRWLRLNFVTQVSCLCQFICSGNIDCVLEEMRMEGVDVMSNTVLKQKGMNVGGPDFYKLLS